jgi:S-adenosylmethionine:tRNA ribosyltransferase-isomerase
LNYKKLKDQIKNISIDNYFYDLPQERIAKFPLDQRDRSQLLIYKNKNIEKTIFKDIDKYIPENSLLIFNETKVVQARIIFQKESGAKIEVFCLEPFEPSREIQIAFQEKSASVWKCFVGNSKRWKSGKLTKKIIYKGNEFIFTAERKNRNDNVSLVEFCCDPQLLSFAQILESSGLVPLPPYLDREAEESDKIRYQTVYAKNNGSVAAPTAGLHFTDSVFQKLEKKNISFEKLTLHVGAGTFKPVVSKTISEHEMHTERVLIKRETIESILSNPGRKVIPVGTTTVRTLESLYWFGVKLIVGKDENINFSVSQWDPYSEELNCGISTRSALEAVQNYMTGNSLDILYGETKLMIAPGYDFKIADGIITNFHQPKSTLLLLIAAFIGDDWKKIYDFAMKNDFRFLSYGDSCLFSKEEQGF